MVEVVNVSGGNAVYDINSMDMAIPADLLPWTWPSLLTCSIGNLGPCGNFEKHFPDF